MVDVDRQKAPRVEVAADQRQLLLALHGRLFARVSWFGLYTGMRTGELLTLRWERVDMAKHL